MNWPAIVSVVKKPDEPEPELQRSWHKCGCGERFSSSSAPPCEGLFGSVGDSKPDPTQPPPPKSHTGIDIEEEADA